VQDVHAAGSMSLPLTPHDPPRGLQFEGKADIIINKTAEQKALNLYQDRIFPIEQIEQMMAHSDRPHKFYRIKPELFVLFDLQNFPDNPRPEWKPT
jgi:hypothetical protein